MNFIACVFRPKVMLKLYIKHEEDCFIRYPNTVEVGWKNKAQAKFFFDQLQSVWISDETLFRVFDNSSRNSKQKFAEFYDN